MVGDIRNQCITWRILQFRSTLIEIERYDGVLLLNEHGDLYFLLHNFPAQIIPFKLKKNLIYREEKRYS